MARAKSIFDREIKYLQTVNKAIGYGKDFFIYRTINGKVEKIAISHMGINLTTGALEVNYSLTDRDLHNEKASELDLRCFSDQAKRYQREALEAQARRRG